MEKINSKLNTAVNSSLKKLCLLDYDFDELGGLIEGLGEPKFRVKQLYDWVALGASFDEMSNIPLIMRNKLSEISVDKPLEIVKSLKANDGSIKFLFKLNDDEIIEGVFLPNNYGNTICISTQVGCRMGCVFCSSGENGLSRNLTAGEIVGQYIEVEKFIASQNSKTAIVIASTSTKKIARQISNIVFMGSGEPLDNYDNTVKAIRMFNYTNGLNISSRNISLSTSGLVDKIDRLSDENISITLSLSLHATLDEARKQLMPIAKKYSIVETIKALKNYFDKTGRRVCLEYVLISGLTDTHFDIERLAKITKGFSCHVNLINLNNNRNKNLQAASKLKAQNFLEKLTKLGVSASLRRSYGSEVFGACGQLRGSVVNAKNQEE